MSKIFVVSDEHWYDELNTIAYYGETEFERTVKQHLKHVFPDFLAFPFKKAIEYSEGNRKPDLALVKKDLTEWWLIEVELSSDNFDHVKKQLVAFLNGNYSSTAVAKYIIKKVKEEHNLDLAYSDIYNLVNDNPPKVLLLADEPVPHWEREISGIDVSICTFQVYKNVDGDEAYKLEGDYPRVYLSYSHARWYKSLPETLEVSNPDIFEDYEGEVELEFKKKLTRWVIMKRDYGLFLKFSGYIVNLPENKSFVISRDSNNRFTIRLN